ncbi:YybH family protein [Calycomorphotria hydatis]|uniref:SnoaL-like domain protein n=1 Tax=Calycomorphotria hydatis TaxID=2528027 RepID=A0A517TEI2_9PLAN|nr:SgcJ/EcaC family oxidoreductase [Calycomorphotria hydatis]QDT66783.1 SnoaL-like domain protein [Calycomorphotria hydatis]
MRFVLCTVLLVVVLTPTCSYADEETSTTPVDSSVVVKKPVDADVAAIWQGSEKFVSAFNSQDAAAVAALWSESGEYIDESGTATVGRQAIEQAYAEFFKANAGAKISVFIDSVRLLSDDAAIEDGWAMLTPAGSGQSTASRYTAIHVKKDGEWLLASVRDEATASPTETGNLADLEWLVGTWWAEEHGHKFESDCKWIANNSFIERRYTLTQVDGTKLSGVQIIGWNAYASEVQSWDFSHGGGYAIGTWTPIEGGWKAEVQGVTGDGSPTSAINYLMRLDDNAYAWKSTDRVLGGAALSDTEDLVIKRQQ